MIIRLQIPPAAKLSNPTTSTATDPGLKFRHKIVYLESLKVNVNKALNRNPSLRTVPITTIQSVAQCLSSIGLRHSSAGRILDMFPELLTSDPYSDIYPIFDFLLNTVNLPFPEIPKSISRCPRLLVSDLDTQLNPAFQFLTQFGFTGRFRITSQTTMLLVSSVEYTLVPKIEFLVGLGLGYEDVRYMVLRCPGLLTFSVENNFRPKAEYFFEEMGGELEELKKFPQYFAYSLEKKIKPRHRMLVEQGFKLSLADMLTVSDGEFKAQLVERLWRMGE